jgi:broad specificity phosphatase PhoE
MTRSIYFISHPNVQISAEVPVPKWPLSELGRERMKSSLQLPWVTNIAAIYSSTEQKAIDGAEILGSHLSLNITKIEDLGENDRSTTGFLKPDEFELTADEFFKFPNRSVRGWETAQAAQNRIVSAITAIAKDDTSAGDIVIVSHGAVGTLLYCHFANKTIDRRWDQPGNGGGNYLKLTLTPMASCDWWKAIDQPQP